MPVFFSPKVGYFSNNKNSTKELKTTYSNAACHQPKLLTGGKKFTHACERSSSPDARALEIHQGLAKKWSDTFLTEWYSCNLCDCILN